LKSGQAVAVEQDIPAVTAVRLLLEVLAEIMQPKLYQCVQDGNILFVQVAHGHVHIHTLVQQAWDVPAGFKGVI
jgi:hypothetical protein